MEQYKSLIVQNRKTEQVLPNEFFTLIENTLNVNDVVDWDRISVIEIFPDFKFDYPYPQKPLPTKKNFILNILDIGKVSETARINKKYFDECMKYMDNKKIALKNYLVEKEKFELRKTNTNINLKYLKYYYEKAEKTAVEKYCSIVLDASVYPSGLEHKYLLSYDSPTHTAALDILLPSMSVFPKIKEFVHGAEGVTPVYYSNDEINSIYESILIAIGVRTLHELFEANYIKEFNFIVLNAYVLRDNMKYSDKNPDFTAYSRCLYGFKAQKDEFISIELNDKDIVKQAEKLKIVRIKKFNDHGELMAPLSMK